MVYPLQVSPEICQSRADLHYPSLCLSLGRLAEARIKSKNYAVIINYVSSFLLIVIE